MILKLYLVILIFILIRKLIKKKRNRKIGLEFHIKRNTCNSKKTKNHKMIISAKILTIPKIEI